MTWDLKSPVLESPVINGLGRQKPGRIGPGTCKA